MKIKPIIPKELTDLHWLHSNHQGLSRQADVGPDELNDSLGIDLHYFAWQKRLDRYMGKVSRDNIRRFRWRRFVERMLWGLICGGTALLIYLTK